MAKETNDTLKDETKTAKKTEKKSGKKTEAKKGNPVVKWFKDLRIEFKNVSWPSWNTVFVNSGIVLGTIVISSAFVGLLDFGLLRLAEFLIGLSQ